MYGHYAFANLFFLFFLASSSWLEPRMGEVEDLTNFLFAQGYSEGKFIGKGSYSSVRVAHSQKYQRDVALKIIDKSKAKKDYVTKFFVRERDIVLKLRHPHIIHFFEILDCGSFTTFVSEYAEGGNLLEAIRARRRLTETQSRFLFRQLLEALNYLHERLIIHRDVKCENIFLDKYGNIKLGDFGFTRNLGPDDLSQTFCGSTAYAAPEITMGKAYRDSSGKENVCWSLKIITREPFFQWICGVWVLSSTS